MPFFQAVSTHIPIDPNGVKVYPSGGPYYIAGRDVGRSVLVKRNTYYKGPRPHNPSLMSISVNTNIDTSLLQVQANQRDYDATPPPSVPQARRIGERRPSREGGSKGRPLGGA
jgi:hypothetical protein